MAAALNEIPEPLRETARSGLARAFGRAEPTHVAALFGGASGAATFRVALGERVCLLRIDKARGRFRNPHQYAAMRSAAAAGVAPPLHLADDAAGVAIMDFIEARPLAEFPGGPSALAEAGGRLIAQLQATPPFPVLDTFPSLLERLFAVLRSSPRYAPGLFDPCLDGFARIRDAYPWDASPAVSSHNDPNPRNILFDGRRLWLIDWETAYRNDPLVDVAIMTHELAAGPDLEAALVRAWSGAEPTAGLRARLALMRLMTQLNYAGLLLGVIAADADGPPETDLTPPTLEVFQADLAAGRMQLGGAAAAQTLGKMVLAQFMAGVTAPGFADLLSTAQEA